MATHEIPELDREGLRHFGLTTGGIVALLFGLVLPWLFDLDYPRWPWIVGGVLIAWGLIHPPSLKPVYYWWMRFGVLLSRVTTPLVLGVVFYVMITPLSLVMRVFGREGMHSKPGPDRSSYRILSERPPTSKMERPF